MPLDLLRSPSRHFRTSQVSRPCSRLLSPKDSCRMKVCSTLQTQLQCRHFLLINTTTTCPHCRGIPCGFPVDFLQIPLAVRRVRGSIVHAMTAFNERRQSEVPIDPIDPILALPGAVLSILGLWKVFRVYRRRRRLRNHH